MNEFEIKNSKRVRKCRMCNENIWQEEIGVSFRIVMQRHFVDIWFHKNCLFENIMDLVLNEEFYEKEIFEEEGNK